MRSWLLAVVLLASVASRSTVALDAAEPQRLDLLKAGYLVNFAKFVEWPASAVPSDVLTVCFRGGSGVRAGLAQDLEHKRVGTRQVALRELTDADSSDGCNVLYIEGSGGSLVSGAHAAGILTIGEGQDFVKRGGIIGLFTEANRLRFSVNVENARRAGLKLSAALLQLASSVEQGAS